MQFTFTVTIDVQRESGKFISWADIEEQLIDAITDADPGTVEVDDSVYAVESFDVEVAK